MLTQDWTTAFVPSVLHQQLSRAPFMPTYMHSLILPLFENRIKKLQQLFPDFPSIPFCVPSWLNVSKEKSTFPPSLLCNTNFVVDRFLCLLPPPEGQLQEDKDLICPVYHYEDSNWHSTFSIYGQKLAQLTFLIW